MKWRPVRLSTRITLSVLVLVVLGALALMFAEEARLRDVYLGERRALLVGTLQTNQLRLAQAIETLRHDVRFLARVPPISGISRAVRNDGFDPRDHDTLDAWKLRLEQIFFAFATARPEYYRIRYITFDEGGRDLVRVDQRSRSLEVMRSVPLQGDGLRPLFADALASGTDDVVVTDFGRDPEGDAAAPALTLQAAVPILAPSGKPFGMVVLSMDARPLVASVREGLPAGVFGYVSDMEGHYLTALGTKDLVNGPAGPRTLTEDLPGLAPLLRPEGPAVLPLQEVATRTGSAMVTAQRIYFDPDKPARFLLVAYHQADEEGVLRASTIPRERIAAGVAVLVLLAGLVRLVLRRTFAPLDQLAAAAARVTAGSREPLLPQPGAGEIGAFTRAINAMLTELTQRDDAISRINAGLERQVAQRTAELTAANARLNAEASERERMLHELETLLLRNQTLMAASEDGIHVMDTDGNVVEVNDAFCRMLGYTREQALRLNVGDWAVDWTAEELRGHFRGMEQQRIRIETRHRRRDGSVIDVEINASGVDIGGQRFIYASSREITERKRAEAVLRQHKTIIDTARDGFWLLDTSGRLLEVNESYARISGYPVEELLGMYVWELEAKAQTPREVTDYIEKMIARGGFGRFETRHRHKDGHEIDIEVSATYIPESRVVSVFCHDITHRKQAEQALRIAAATFETRDAIVITDAANNIVRVNGAFTEITGYSAEEVIGRNPRMMNSGRHDRRYFIEMWQQLLHAGSWAGEILDRRKNGEIYPKWLTITAVRDERGEITHFVGIFSDITARKQAEEEIRTLAFYDPLTRLPNRRLFLDRLRAVLAASSRHDDHGAVLFIDLDRFKSLNDALGHEYGDLMLIEVARRLKAGVREMDTVARLGGDEFVVLFEAVSADRDDASHKVGAVAEKIRLALSMPYHLRDHEHHSSPSIGITLFHGTSETVDRVLRQADMAMYQAKESGRNAVRFFEPAMQREADNRAALERDLRQALAQEQLQLYYQLQVDDHQHPLGAEALLRWHHPERGVVMPLEFLPVAEEGALILDIGRWVLQSACRQLARWAEQPRMRGLTLAINISRKQFALADFVEQVADCLRAHRFDPRQLKLELTERLVLDDMEVAIEKMRALRALGLQLSMDEFGTGYSSLSYLGRLPLDQLKIDQGFVRGISDDGNDAVLVRTIIDLASSARVDVIAEGVETEAQFTFLQKHACEAYQGFLFSEAVGIDDFEALLARIDDSHQPLAGDRTGSVN